MKNKLQACIINDHDDGTSIFRLLKKEFPEFDIDIRTGSIHYASRYLSSHSPDLLFADFRLEDQAAIDMLSEFMESDVPVIFIADSEKSAIQAIKKGITDYLLKPVTNLDFVLTVNKAVENLRKNKIRLFPSVQHKINLPTLQGFKRVSIDEIIRCEADSNYTVIHMLDRTKIMVSKTLCDFEKNLSEHHFFRIHHKHLINLEHLKEYIKGKGGQVVMSDHSVLDVSTRRKHHFLHTIA